MEGEKAIHKKTCMHAHTCIHTYTPTYIHTLHTYVYVIYFMHTLHEGEVSYTRQNTCFMFVTRLLFSSSGTHTGEKKLLKKTPSFLFFKYVSVLSLQYDYDDFMT